MTTIAQLRKMTPSLKLTNNHDVIIKVLDSKVRHLTELLERHKAINDPAEPRSAMAQIMAATVASFDDLIQWATIQREFAAELHDLLEFEAAVVAEAEKQAK